MTRYVLVRYHEVALKGKNKPFFLDALVRNLRLATAGTGVRQVWKGAGYIGLTLADEADWPTVRDRVAHVFGVANFGLAYRTDPDLDKVKALITTVIRGQTFSSFRITTSRADKQFPLTSEQINRVLGAHVVALTGARVDLTNPDLTIYVEWLPKEVYVSLAKEPGPGGLPVGTSGRLVSLLSGGIDSPVAAYRMMKRGCRVTFVHFHSHPFLSAESQEKARELVQLLTRYQYHSRLYLVAFGEVQQEIVVATPAPLRVVLYRRMMARIAERLARQEGALALVTGENLGQVASQTLENLVVIQDATPMPILRPLIGMDKREIIAEAEAIGTYRISILPDQDCCQLFTPRRPATRSTVEEVRAAEAALDIEGLIARALDQTTVEEYHWPTAPATTPTPTAPAPTGAEP